MWYKLLYYLRMFKATSYLVRSFIKILKDMFAFILMYIVATFAFSQAFYVVSAYHEYLEIDEGYYQSYQHAFTAVMQTMLAGSGDLDVNATALAFIIHCACLLVIYLTMLNMLIASVASSFEEVQST